MGVLRVLLALVDDRLFRKISVAVYVRHVRTNHLHRVIGDARGVGTHVGDQTDAPSSPEFDAFVEPLREHHRLLHGEAQLARRFLLQLAGGERRNGVTLLFLGDDGFDVECRAFQALAGCDRPLPGS